MSLRNIPIWIEYVFALVMSGFVFCIFIVMVKDLIDSIRYDTPMPPNRVVKNIIPARHRAQSPPVQPQVPQAQQQPQTPQFQPWQWKQPQFSGLVYGYTHMWHGTTELRIAIDIVMFDRWLIGGSAPPGVWFTPVWDYATTFRGNGVVAVVKVKITDDSHLTQEAPDRFRVSVGNINDGKYYRVFGIKPVEIYDLNGAQVY